LLIRIPRAGERRPAWRIIFSDSASPRFCMLPRTIRLGGSALILLFAALPAPGAIAQERNEAILSRMIASCLPSGTIQDRQVALTLPDEIAFAGPDAIAALAQNNNDVVFGDSTQADGQRRADRLVLEVALDEADVAYARSGRRSVDRTVSLRVRYVLTDASRVVVASDRCTSSETDAIRRSSIDDIENSAYPVTQGDRPAGSTLGRILTPVVTVAATAVATYLLFALRSKSDADS